MPRAARQVPWLESLGGVFYVFWYDRQSKRTRRLTLRTRDAVEAADRYASFLKQGTQVYSARRSDGPLVGDVVGDYEREHVNGVVVRNGRSEPRMVARARTVVCLGHLRRHLGDSTVASLGVAACEAYLAKRRAEGVSDPTVRRELSILCAAINHAVRRDRVEFNTRKLALPAASEPNGRWLTYNELDHLRRIAGDPEKGQPVVAAFIEVAYYTASRAEAVMLMEPFQVKLATSQIDLDKPGAVRTKKRRPTVPIDPALRPVVERLLIDAKKEGRKYLLPAVGQRSDRRILDHFKTIARRAGFDDVTPHTLRHTRATHLLQRGASIWEVAKLLGDTVATVDRVYGHHCTDAVARALEAHGRAK